MAKGNLAACLKITLAHEGGYTNDRRDPGNWTGGKVGVGVLKGTKYGVAANTYPDLDIKNLTLADVEPIYRKNYWFEVGGDSLPAGVDLAAFDFGVHSGPARAVRNLQAVVGAKQDGQAGAETILKTSKANAVKTIQALFARRTSFARVLPTFKTFGKGWLRRFADTEAKAVAMALSRLPASSKQISLETEARKADEKARTQSKQAAGTPVAGGAGGVAAGDLNWLLIGGIAAAVVVVTVLLVVHARKNRERARAYSAAAAG